MARDDYFDDGDEGGFFKRHGVALVIGVIVLGGGGFVAWKMVSSGHGSSQTRRQTAAQVHGTAKPGGALACRSRMPGSTVAARWPP